MREARAAERGGREIEAHQGDVEPGREQGDARVVDRRRLVDVDVAQRPLDRFDEGVARHGGRVVCEQEAPASGDAHAGSVFHGVPQLVTRSHHSLRASRRMIR